MVGLDKVGKLRVVVEFRANRNGRRGSLYLQVELYTPDREGNEVKLDEGADVKVPEPERDERVDDKSAAVSVGRTSSLLDGDAAVGAVESTVEEPAAVRPTSELPGSVAVSVAVSGK